MPLTNPAAIIHQNLIKSMDEVKPSPTQSNRSGLLTPRTSASKLNEAEVNNPINRIATYVDTIRKKRGEIEKNGN